MGVLDEIAAERRRAIELEGLTPEYEDRQDDGQLARAAAAFALSGQHDEYSRRVRTCPNCWPWEREYWNPKSSRQDLVTAAVFIIAEIERLDRAALATPSPAQEPGTGDTGKIVPHEATDEMIASAGAYICERLSDHDDFEMDEVWRRFLAAIPATTAETRGPADREGGR